MTGDPQNPYLLLTPGPLSTTASVKREMLRDWCTWDDDYNLGVVQDIRARLVSLATPRSDWTCVLMQGSGTFCVEAVIGSAIPADGKLLVAVNGAYGRRISTIAETLKIPVAVEQFGETEPIAPARLAAALRAHPDATHAAMVHCETTTGILNPVAELCAAVKAAGRTAVVDAMSSFGGIPMDAADMGADFLVSSANKCVQGVPGFGFILASRETMEACAGQARSHSLDLWGQWNAMESGRGKWRFTSPTHVVRAFQQALRELEDEGGIAARHRRYQANHWALVEGFRGLGFETLLADEWQSPFITAFLSPQSPDYDFRRFYNGLKERGFVIYPGKVSDADTFRVGSIGEVYPEDMVRLTGAAREAMFWRRD